MTKEKKDQINLYKLIYTVNWEDPQSDHKALKIQPGERVMSITSGACNTLGFLVYDPSVIYAVDINPSQSFLLELKIAAMKHLDYQEFIQFLGLAPCDDRSGIYQKIKVVLSREAADFWDSQTDIIRKGFLLNGRYENFVKLVGRLIRLIQGKKRVDHLFIEKSLEKQREFYNQYWDIRRTRFIFNAFFNKKILAKKGLKADYFHFDDGSASFSESFFKRFKKVVHDIPLKGNYFLYLYLKGHYKSPEEVPIYLREKDFALIKTRLDRVKIITDDAKSWLASMPEDSLDCLSLSNICELMSLSDTEKMFREVLRTAKPNARLCFRNLMIPREVPEQFRSHIKKDDALSHEIFNADTSFVYSKVDAYRVEK